MKGITDKRDITCAGLPYLIARAAVVMLLFFICAVLMTARADAATVTFRDSDGGTLSDPDTEYTIKGSGSRKTSTKYFDVPEGKSSQAEPITIILDGVNITQEDKSPDHSFIHIEENNYVIIKLRNTNYIRAWSHQEVLSSNDGMSAIHVSKDATVKITSEQGDGSTSGSLEAYGGGGEYGGAAIGARYNKKMGTVVIAGGTIKARGGKGAAGIGGGRNDTDGYENDVQITGGKVEAYGGDEGAGIGSGRDGKAYSISISGGEVYSEGGKYAAGIGAGNAADLGSGGNLVELSITGGKIKAHGGEGGAGIGCSDEGEIEDKIRISSDSSAIDVEAYGGDNAAGIGGGNKSNLDFEDRIEIKGRGSVKAYGGADGAGIGGGNDGGGPRIDIEGNTNGKYGSRGESPEGSRTLGITVVAGRSDDEDEEYSFGNEAAAIGSGKATGGDISISNAVLNTRADGEGADIGGGGYHATVGGAVHNIFISNCEIISTSTHKVAPGIGSGYGGTVHNISIRNTKYSGGGIGGAPMDHNYRNLNDVKSITIDNSDINAVWDQEHPGRFEGGTTPSTEPQEHGAAGIGSGQYGSMDTIMITDSRIVASGYGSGSGIGGGGLGGNGFMFFDFTKWESGDTGTIEISGSDVDAHSGKANFDPHSPIVYWDGHVWIKIDNPQMFGGGAGIGGGSGSDTEKIWIHDCGEIRAIGDGCGIGTGAGTGMISKGAVKYIWLENIEYVYAEAGHDCAGIGTGGSDGGINEWNIYASALTQIYINDCRDLDAHGGEGGAGIGLGSRSSYHTKFDPTEKSSWSMEIVDSNVAAYGGEMGAGIGGGFEDVFTGLGGDSPKMLIRGKSTVHAVGGKELEYEDGAGLHGGGAGIGGGADGAGSVIQIELEEDYNCAAKGTYDNPSASKYYVRAFGQGGGAGIGSGGITYHEMFFNNENADTFEVRIKSGAVFAIGSDSTRLPDGAYRDFYMGAGAGIGGGSLGSQLNNLFIEGGYVYAEAGDYTEDKREKADAIGAGGLASRKEGGLVDSNRENGYLEISDGTVISDDIGTFINERKISGGSVKAVVDRATGVVDINGERVYRTTAKLPKDIKNEKVDAFSTSRGYGGKHIYADENGKVYLYLYEKGTKTDHKQWADIEVNTEAAGKNDWHYTGYTDTSHKGLLKLESSDVPFRDPGTVRIGDDFELYLDDGDVKAGTKWDSFEDSGSASIKIVDKDTSPGVSLSMKANSVGDYSVAASSSDSADPEIYWGNTARYSGTVLKAMPKIEFTEDPSKIYDSQPVKDPDFITDSSGKAEYRYYRNGSLLDSRPSEAGSYEVEVVIAEDGVHESGSERMGFVITPADTDVSVGLRQDGGTGIATATVSGLYEADGSVEFTVTGSQTTVSVDVSGPDENGMYAAVLKQDALPEGEYTVTAEYVPASGNYSGSAGNASGNKAAASRTINGEFSYEKLYGDSYFDLELSASSPGSNDAWSYEVISDSYSGYSDQTSVSVTNAGKVNVQHAGSSVIKVTLRDESEPRAFIDAVAYVKVDVSRAELTVTPFAYSSTDPDREKVKEVKYGRIGTLAFDLEYKGFKNGDTADDFTHGHGSLSAGSIPETTAASDTPQEIPVIRTGVPVSIGGTTRNVFYSRDYTITEDASKYALTVCKASIALQIENATGIYGGDEPGYSWKISDAQGGFDGPASWDSEQTIFTKDPAIGLDRKNYKELDAKTYPDILIAKDEGQSGNYEPSFSPGSLTVMAADMSDSSRFICSAENTVYNGSEQKQKVTVTDSALGKILRENSDYTLIYPEGQCTDAGMVIVDVAGKGNYDGCAKASYGISRKELTARTDSAEKEYDGTPLKAGGSLSGLVTGETAVLNVTGSQTEVGSSRNTCDVEWTGSTNKNNYKLVKDLGTLTVTAPETVYTCVEGAGGTWKYGSGSTISFTIQRNWHDDETLSHFRRIEIDDKAVSEYSYTTGQTDAKSGVVIKLRVPYLKNLGIGDHSMTVQFNDGKVSDIPFSIVRGTPSLEFTEDPSKTYDTEPVKASAVTNGETEEISYEYFKNEDCTVRTGTADGAEGPGMAPANAGKYWVKATAAETEHYESVSKALPFEIYQAPTSVMVSLSQTGTTGTVTAVVIGLYKAEGSVRFTVNGSQPPVPVEVSGPEGGPYTAVLTQQELPAGEYTVRAVFVPGSGNYIGSEGTASGKEELSTRDITTKDDKRSVSRTYGEQGFNLRDELEMKVGEGKETDKDAWKFDLIWDSYSAQGLDPAVTVDRDSGVVSVQHAGKAVIRVTLSDGLYLYYDAVTDVTVDVGRAGLDVTSYAYEKGSAGTDKPAVKNVRYGKIDSTLDYDLKYSGLVNGDTPGNTPGDTNGFTHGHGILEPVPIPKETGASETDKNKIAIKRTGSDGGFFFCRDYDIKEDTVTNAVTVEKASIAIDINDAKAAYGGKEPLYSWRVSDDQKVPESGTDTYDGLAEWDSRGDVFTKDPEIKRTGTAAGGFKELDAGTYEGVLAASDGWSSANYAPVFRNGTLLIERAKISDFMRFGYAAKNAVYDGTVKKQTVTVIDKAFDPAKELGEEDVVMTYPDDEEMTDAGYVRVRMKGLGNYCGNTVKIYRISPAPLTVITEGAQKIYDGKPLTAPGEMSGLAGGETAELKVTGSQTEIGSSENTFEIDWKTAKKSNYEIAAYTGMLEVLAPETKYYCVKGSGGVWKHGSKEGLSFTFKRSWNDNETFDRFRSIHVDGKKVPAGAYTTKSGSVIITVGPEYLDKLGNGEHVLKTAFNDGIAPDVSFSVTGKRKDDNDGGNGGNRGAGTGDDNSIALWIAILITTAAGLSVLTLKRRKDDVMLSGQKTITDE